VANDQRKVVYQLRDELMGTEDVKERYETIRDGVLSDLFFEYISPKALEADWDVLSLEEALRADYGENISIQEIIDKGHEVDEVLSEILKVFDSSHEAKEASIGAETMRTFEKAVMLRALDQHWKEHLAVMDSLRQSVNLRGYGQKNPVQEFKRESFSMFTLLLDTINIDMVKAVCSVSLEQTNLKQEERELKNQQKPTPSKAKKSLTQRTKIMKKPITQIKVGRNDPCPCGSGKKYKQCHG